MDQPAKYSWQFYFVLLIPLINAIASNTTEYTESDILNPGNIRAFVIGIFAVYFVFTRLPNEKISRFVLFYLIYYLILVVFATDRMISGNLYLKFFLGVIMLPIGYYYVNTIEKFEMLIRVLFFTLVLHLINVAIANLFQLGTSDYLDNTFYFGAGRVNITKNILILVFMLPVTMLFMKRYRKTVLVFFMIAFLIALIGIKRSVLISAAAGVVTYLLVKQRISLLIRTAIIISVLLLIMIFGFPSVVDLFTSRFEARGQRVELSEETIETEGRVNEVDLVANAWVAGSFKHKLIGSEVFNDRLFFKSKRMLHTDYMIILNCSGIIGFILWFYMFFRLLREKNKYFRFLKNHIVFREANAVFWILMVTQILLSISGTIYAIEVRSLIFLFWGAFLGAMRGVLRKRAGLNGPDQTNLRPVSR